VPSVSHYGGLRQIETAQQIDHDGHDYGLESHHGEPHRLRHDEIILQLLSAPDM